MQYKAYPKQALIAAMRRRQLLSGDIPVKGPSIFDFSKWPQWWEAGAKELEKTSPGKLITAPVRLPEAIVSSTTKTIKETPGILKTVSYSVPLVAVAAGIVGISYLVYRYKKEKNVSILNNKPFSEGG